ncbi:MAG: hypothetical protein WA067_01050 [Microgenomates group bacterium]
MPTQGLENVVTYKLNGPAGTEKEVNIAEMRGVNDNSPMMKLQTIFGKLSGSKTQDSLITLPSGVPVRALGMNKIKRFAGLTKFMTLEPATYHAVDAQGNCFAGIKVRLDFNRNVAQLLASKPDFDYSSLWYYDAACIVEANGEVKIDIDHARLRAVVLNEVWQFRLTAGPWFYNWGHSVTIIPGNKLSGLPVRWWEKFDYPNTDADAMGAAAIMNYLIGDLSTGAQPWLEFSPLGEFSDSYLVYSAGDADQYANWDRVLLDRQQQYVVMYRPNNLTAWDWITIKPIYNYEWNDVTQNLSKFHGWTGDIFKDKIDERGLPKDPRDSVISEVERIGWMNGPNASLAQIQYIGREGQILYTQTIRAYIGAKDTLVMFGPGQPMYSEAKKNAVNQDGLQYPWAYDDNGQPIANPPMTQDQWVQLQQEGSMWNYLKGDNPFNSDLFIQYRFTDDTTWRPITCSDSDGNSYTCGWNPVDWNLDSTYFFQGNVDKPWYITQLLGEVGMRTLGMSYNSCLYCGTGMEFAMDQMKFHSDYFTGFTQESVWMFDARAMQLPDSLAISWAKVHQ